MNHLIENRREFLKHASLAALALPLVIGCKGDTLARTGESEILTAIKKNARERGGEGMGAIDAPADVSWKSVLPAGKDDGEPMIISGTVFEHDGNTPVPNVLIYFYHTDKFGIYGRKGEPRHGRFRGWMLTDAWGRYEFRSIRPASYPDTTFAAHVHMTVTGQNFREDWIDSVLFEGDKFITAKEREEAGRRGGFQPIVTLSKGKDGVVRGVRDIQLMRS